MIFAFYSPMITPMDKQREDAALLIAASIVAAIRLRGEKVAPTPKVTFIISESVEIVRMVWRSIQRGDLRGHLEGRNAGSEPRLPKGLLELISFCFILLTV